jgi:two-component system, cell cycle response regulator DivK
MAMDPESILVVEDNALNLKLVRAVLENAGFRVRAAMTAEDAVAEAVADPPDLVLMDLQLPGMDGYEGLLALRSDPATRGIPVLAVTALAMQQDREKVHRAGFDGYIEKPISVRDLPEQVRDVLRHPRRLP